MKIVKSVNQMQRLAASCKLKKQSIGFVPTMGALHEGHLSLIRAARKENDRVVVSIFVNPSQFAPHEDLSRYPRPFKKDCALCSAEAVDVLFNPSVLQMYPAGFKTSVAVEGVSGRLCGKSRPGHFKGVATVVAKLFNIVLPDRVYFGAKDAQQALIIRQMSQDLNFSLKIKVLPTVRDGSGLALSSRNQYLTLQEKSDAYVLFNSLELASRLVKEGHRSAKNIIKKIKELITAKKSAKIDYVEIVDAKTLEPVKDIRTSSMIALAVKIGKTRLIDNKILHA